MRLLLIFVGIAMSIAFVHGQQSLEHYNEEIFAFQVKQIDEFIERFNNADDALIKKYLSKRYDLEPERDELILSLFDHNEFDEDERVQAISFINEVVDAYNPPYLSFYDNDWFAKLSCNAMYLGEPISFDMVMKIRTTQEGKAVNWSIQSLNSKELEFGGNFDSNTLLSPSTHGTNFQELHRMFEHAEQYYDNTQPTTHPMNRLLHLASQGKFSFSGVKRTTYHFLQLDNWILKVEEFNRRTDNSGWLISKVYRADAETKERYLLEQLYIN